MALRAQTPPPRPRSLTTGLHAEGAPDETLFTFVQRCVRLPPPIAEPTCPSQCRFRGPWPREIPQTVQGHSSRHFFTFVRPARFEKKEKGVGARRVTLDRGSFPW